ncbi:MAG: hypothetical protein JKY20_05645, partial [Alphaproteobacteria bacterium]|nr:hypothetical protein [Alphaproteobacteria bacterium]
MTPPEELTTLSPLQALQWSIAAGADEAIGDAPINRYAQPASQPTPQSQAQPQVQTRQPTALTDRSPQHSPSVPAS